jgi:predicted phage-related endonuclease
MTGFELAITKESKDPTEFEASERAEWGLRLEHAVAKAICQDYGVKGRRLTAYATNERAGMGASFDYEIVGINEDISSVECKDLSLRDLYKAMGPGVLEIKCVDNLIYRNEWVDDEAPPHIEIQVQHQLHCIERDWAAIGVLVGGNRFELLTRERDEEVGKAIEGKCIKFWKDLKAGKRPPPELPQDADVIRRLYAYAEPGKVLDAQDKPEIIDLCAEYTNAARVAKDAEARKKTAQAKLLQLIVDAEKVLVPGFSVSAGVVAETLVPAYTRKGYRNLRITVSKDTAKAAEAKVA